MRLCFYLETLNAGGIERVTFNLVNEFINKQLDVDFYISSLSGQYLSQVPKGVKIFPGSGRVRNILPFLRYLYKKKPDALITSNIHVSIISIIICKLLRIPLTLVVTVHIHSSRANQANNFIRAFMMKELAKIFYPMADKVVAVSESVANDLNNFINFPRHRIDVIYNPVVTKELLEGAKERIEHPWFETNDVPIILGSGRLSKQKDFHTLINAFAKVRETIDAKLIILGEGEERVSLENLIHKLGLEKDISLIGYVENPYAYMAKASMFVLSSIYEGLPTVIIEALALGIPVIATDSPGGSSEILDKSRYGTLVPMGNSDAIADAIFEVLRSDPDKEVLIKRGMEFSAQRAAEHYLRVINSV